MLGKLLRQEFCATYRPFLLLYGATVLMVALMFVSFQIPQAVVGAFLMVALMLLSLVLLVLTVVLVAKRFHTNFYGSQGYLMFALPVPAWKLLLAKLIPAILWVSASLLFFLTGQFSGLLAVDGEVLENAGQLIDETYAELGLPPLRAFLSLLPLMTFSFFISVIFFVSLLYFSITLANTGRFQRHSGLWAGLLFVGLYAGYCALEIFMGILVPWGLQFNQDGWDMVTQGMAFGMGEPVFRVGLISFPASIAATLVLFWLTTRLMKRHLSLK